MKEEIVTQNFTHPQSALSFFFLFFFYQEHFLARTVAKVPFVVDKLTRGPL